METLITKTEAASILGITLDKFNALKIEPAKTTKNPYNRAALMYLYLSDDILNLKDTEQVKALQPKIYQPKDYASIFAKRYSAPKDALQDVCYSLFNLNRYAKHASCTMANREEIYSLKAKLIKHLYVNDYCVDVQFHTQSGYGEGRFNRSINEYEDDYYWEVSFYSFTFDISGTVYNWHQPKEDVCFEVKDISATREIGCIKREQPTMMKPTKFKEAKELIQWFYINQRNHVLLDNSTLD